MKKAHKTKCRACGEDVDHPLCSYCIAKLSAPQDHRDRHLKEIRRLLALFKQNPMGADPQLIKELCSHGE